MAPLRRSSRAQRAPQRAFDGFGSSVRSASREGGVGHASARSRGLTRT